MDESRVHQLIGLGLSKYEARAYLALMGHERASAVEVADRSGVPRQRIYDVLAGLRDRNLIVSREGRPARHTALEPAIALFALLEARRHRQQVENERLAALVETVVSELSLTANKAADGNPTGKLQDQDQETKGGF